MFTFCKIVSKPFKIFVICTKAASLANIAVIYYCTTGVHSQRKYHNTTSEIATDRGTANIQNAMVAATSLLTCNTHDSSNYGICDYLPCSHTALSMTYFLVPQTLILIGDKPKGITSLGLEVVCVLCYFYSHSP